MMPRRRTARGEERRGRAAERDDDVGHDVCQHDVVPRAEAAAQARVGEMSPRRR